MSPTCAVSARADTAFDTTVVVAYTWPGRELSPTQRGSWVLSEHRFAGPIGFTNPSPDREGFYLSHRNGNPEGDHCQVKNIVAARKY